MRAVSEVQGECRNRVERITSPKHKKKKTTNGRHLAPHIPESKGEMPQEPESVCKGGGKSESQPDPEVDVVGPLVEKSTLAVSLSGMATLKMCPGCIRKPSIILSLIHI